MNARDVIKAYDEITNKIPEKLKKVYEFTKEWKYFDGKCLSLKDYEHPFSSLARFRGTEHFFLNIVDKTTFRISWYNNNYKGYFSVNVSDMFFDDFNLFIEYVKNLVSENNKTELEKYTRYLEKQVRDQELFKGQEYQEYLKLKEKFEKSIK